MSIESFIQKLLPTAQELQSAYGIPTSVTLAQAIHESGGGESTPQDVHSGQESNNLFGYKGSGPNGSVQSWTWEVINGQRKKVLADFRAYDSITESVKDYGELLANSSRYAPAFKYKDNPKTFIAKVREGGYATDPSYTEKVTNIMEQYNLTQYDDGSEDQSLLDIFQSDMGFWERMKANMENVGGTAWDLLPDTGLKDIVEDTGEAGKKVGEKAKDKAEDVQDNWQNKFVEPFQNFFSKVTSQSFGVSVTLTVIGIVLAILTLYKLFIAGGGKTVIESSTGGGTSE